jgi:transmembrane sensor
MNYLEFDIEDFLLDTSFQEYCLGNNPDSVSFWKNWLNEHPEKTEMLEKARALYYQLNGNITAKDFSRDYQSFQQAVINHKILNEPGGSSTIGDIAVSKGSSVRTLWLSIAALAACMVLGLTLYLYQKPSKKATSTELTYVSVPGKKLNIKLKDGTHIILNGGSTLKISQNYGQNSRSVSLDGEAYFVVKHDAHKPFTVHTAYFNIKDLGTIFNVKAYKADKTGETSLLEGSIEIFTGNNVSHRFKAIVLKPNNKLVMSRENMTGALGGGKQPRIMPLTVNTTNNTSLIETDWTQNRLSFNEESLDNLALKLERWYGVKINISATADRSSHFTATFGHENVDQVLEALQLSGNFNYRKETNGISIY